jgi:hypothetical protein
MEEKPIEHYEGKVLAAADKWHDAKYRKVGSVSDCVFALAKAVTDLRREREKQKPP